MGLYLGSTDLSAADFYLGSNTVSAIYQGSTQLYPTAGPWTPPGTPLIYSDANDAPSGTGGVWPDKSGNGYDATANGGMTYTSAGDASYFEYNRTAYSHQWDLDVWTNHSPYSAFSVVAIYNPTFAANDQQKILSFYNAGQWVMQPDFQTASAGRTFARNSGGTYSIALASSGAWTAGSWSMYASIWTGANIEFYKNTSLIATAALTSLGSYGGGSLQTGEPSNRYPLGKLGAVLFYDSALSGTDLSDIYTHFSARYGF